MELNVFQSFANANAAPWLPTTELATWALKGSWAVVLATGAMRLSQALGPRWRFWGAALVALWTCGPGSLSPAYWLGLAFQMPSLMSVGLCIVWGVQMGAAGAVKAPMALHGGRSAVVLTGIGIALGWVLLGDLLAWWPLSIYAWGFGTPAFAIACGVVLLMWLVSSVGKTGSGGVFGLAAVLLVFVLTRLPSGNLWDALLDPWLWLILQFRGVAAVLRMRR